MYEMKNDKNCYYKTGMSGVYDPDATRLYETFNGGVINIFDDADYGISNGEMTRERRMVIEGRVFRITSVFADLYEDAPSPTDRMLSYIDAQMHSEAHSA